MSKKAEAHTVIIGHSDGPTSVFICGREKPKGLRGYFRYWKHRIINKLYKIKRAGIEKKITAAPHSLDEVVKYVTDKYHAEEITAESDEALKKNSSFDERRRECKACLIQKFKPELVGRSWEITPPDFDDEEAVLRMLKEADELKRLAEEVPDEKIPLDYHLYHFTLRNIGEYYLEIERNYFYFSGTYTSKTGKLKAMNSVEKDIYGYYGVSRQDIEEKSERYSMLVTVLAT